MTTTSDSKASSAAPLADRAASSALSRDGTAIGYRLIGHGPGLVVLHGAASSAYNHLQLAGELSDAFTMILPDRRGRGLSGPYRFDDRLWTESRMPSNDPPDLPPAPLRLHGAVS